MDYEKKYKEALERAGKVLLDCTDDEANVVKFLFPELRESEDERIRKAIKYYLEDMPAHFGFAHGVGKSDMLAWLEKQKEQKPVEWSEEDEKMMNSVLAELANHINYNKPLNGMPSGTGWTSYKYQQEMDWLTNKLKSLRPQKKEDLPR